MSVYAILFLARGRFNKSERADRRCPLVLCAIAVVLSVSLRIATAQSSPTLSGLTRSGSAQFTGSMLRLTDGGYFEQGSAFTSLDVRTFQTQFNFQLSAAQADGFAFVIQNQGANALGGEGGNLGYVGIQRSVAVAFDLYNNHGEGSNSTYLLTAGSPISKVTNLTSSGIELHSGHLFHATISYTGTLLIVTVKDLMSGAQSQQVYEVDLYAQLGNTTAFVGFTGGTGGLTATQDISAWTFGPRSQIAATGSNPIDYPNGFPSDTEGLTLSGASFVKGALQLTDGNLFESRTAWYNSPVDVRAFNTDFTFQLQNAMADGFTFTIQNDPSGPTAIGTGGGQLGYGGIKSSVAIKFDVFNNAGEGQSSTGFYGNGAEPTVPALDMTPLYLNSGDVIQAHVAYDGSILTLNLYDLANGIRFQASKQIDIPAVVGASFAYVGFTGGTGGYSATQNILNWTYGYDPASSNAPDMTVTSNTGDQYSAGGLYNEVVLLAQDSGALPTFGAITITDTLPAGLTATAMSGPGWDCDVATVTCTTSAVVTANEVLPAVRLFFDVNPAYAGTVQNLVTVSGGGEVNIANDTFAGIAYLVQAPLASLTFSPASIPVGATTVETLVLTNPSGNTVPLRKDFDITFPSGFIVVPGEGSGNDDSAGCYVRQAGDLLSGYAFIGAVIPVNGKCSYSFFFTGTDVGSYTSVAEGFLAPVFATASITVTPAPASAVRRVSKSALRRQ